jgi:hypothetical protein
LASWSVSPEETEVMPVGTLVIAMSRCGLPPAIRSHAGGMARRLILVEVGEELELVLEERSR